MIQPLTSSQLPLKWRVAQEGFNLTNLWPREPDREEFIIRIQGRLVHEDEAVNIITVQTFPAVTNDFGCDPERFVIVLKTTSVINQESNRLSFSKMTSASHVNNLHVVPLDNSVQRQFLPNGPSNLSMKRMHLKAGDMWLLLLVRSHPWMLDTWMVFRDLFFSRISDHIHEFLAVPLKRFKTLGLLISCCERILLEPSSSRNHESKDPEDPDVHPFDRCFQAHVSYSFGAFVTRDRILEVWFKILCLVPLEHAWMIRQAKRLDLN